LFLHPIYSFFSHNFYCFLCVRSVDRSENKIGTVPTYLNYFSTFFEGGKTLFWQGFGAFIAGTPAARLKICFIRQEFHRRHANWIKVGPDAITIVRKKAFVVPEKIPAAPEKIGSVREKIRGAPENPWRVVEKIGSVPEKTRRQVKSTHSAPMPWRVVWNFGKLGTLPIKSGGTQIQPRWIRGESG